MKRITIFVHCFPPAKGGVEFLTGEIVKILSSNYQVNVFAGKGASLDSYKTFSNFINSKSNNDIHRLNLKRFQQRLANKVLSLSIKRFGFLAPFYFGPILLYPSKAKTIIKESDLIIGMGMPTKSFYDGYKFAKKYQKPLILHPSYHDVPYYNNCLLFKKALDYAAKIIYQTKLEKAGLQKAYSIKEDKLVKLIYCPFIKEDVESQKDKLKRESFKKLYKNRRISFGFVGQISQRKNLQMIDGFVKKYDGRLTELGFKTKYILAGAKTNTSKEVSVLFKNSKTEIIYDFKNKKGIFDKIDFFINPSFEESLGLVNFEAIYYLKPLFLYKEAPFLELFPPSAKNNSFSNTRELMEIVVGLLRSKKKLVIKLRDQLKILDKYNQNSYEEQLFKLVSQFV